MGIGLTELAVLAVVLGGLCWIPAPAFVWHYHGRWFAIGASLVVIAVCLVAGFAQWLGRYRPFASLRLFASGRG